MNEIRYELCKGGKVDDWITKLHDELKEIRKRILEMAEFKDIIEFSNKKRKEKKKEYNLDGAAFCLIIQEKERLLMLAYYNIIIKSGFVIGSIIHDGFLIDKSKEITADMLDKWNKMVAKQQSIEGEGYEPYILRMEEMEIDNS